LEPHADTAEKFDLVKKTSKLNGSPLSVWWSAFHLYAEKDAKPEQDHPKRGRQYCCCNACGTDYVVDETGATGVLMRHMKKDHKKAYAELFRQSSTGKKRAAAASQPDIRASLGGVKKAKTKSEKNEECAELTARWVVKTLQPYSAVDSEDFRNMFRAHNPHYEAQSSSDIRSRITMMEDNIRKATIKSLEGEWLALTIAANGKLNYTGMSVHWIDEHFVQHSLKLGCFLHERSSDSEHVLSDFAEKLFMKCGFDKANIISVTTGTTDNMDKFGRLLEKLGIHHINCTDHVLNQTAKKAYEGSSQDTEELDEHLVEDSKTMTKARALVKLYTKSKQKKYELLSKQKSMDTYKEKRAAQVIVDVITRWWSTFRTVDRLLYLKPAFASLEAENLLDDEVALTPHDWAVLKETHVLLKPFKTAQELLEGDKYVSISWVPLMVGTLRKLLKQTADAAPGNTVDAAARNLAKALHDDFCVRWRDANAPVFDPKVVSVYMQRQVGIHPLICLATCMDPRFKNLPTFRLDEKEGLWKALLDWMVKMAPSVTPPHEPPVVPPPEAGMAAAPDNAATGTLPPSMRDQAYDDNKFICVFLEELDMANMIENQTGLDQGATGMSLMDRLEDELKRYRARPSESVFINARTKEYRNPLIWWKNNKADFPIMSELAKILLCIPATSAPSERIFSLASRVISEVRSSLNPDDASQIIFVNGALDWFDQLS
jgi:hypothetical protein